MSADLASPVTLAAEDVLGRAPDAVLCIDITGTIIGAWGACEAIFGDEPGDLIGVNGFSRLHPDDVAYTAGALLEASSRDGAHLPMNFRVLTRDQQWVVVEAATSNGRLADTDVLVLSIRQLTYRGHMDERRAELQRRCMQIATAVAVSHGSQLRQALTGAVESIAEFFGVAAARLITPGMSSTTVGDPISWPDPDGSGEGFVDHGRIGGHNILEVAVPADGPACWQLAWTQTDPGMSGWAGAHLEDLRIAGAVAASAVARLDLEGDLIRRARQDPLTGLANRVELETQLQRMLDVGPATVLFCDLDNFKQANDRHGHAFGDAVLAAVAARLARTLRSSDLLGRVGGDEFVAACPDLPGAATRGTINRLERCLREPVHVAGDSIRVGVSIGAASGPRGSDARTLIAAADAAMYVIKADRHATR